MIEDNTFSEPAGHRVLVFARYSTRTDSDIPDDNLICVYAKGIVLQADTVTRSCLPCNGNIWVFYSNRAFKLNISGHPENHGSWPGCFNSCPEAAFPPIV